MKKFAYVAAVSGLFILMNCSKKGTMDTAPLPQPQPQPQPQPVTYTPKDVYYYTYADIDGKNVSVSGYKDKKIMFVNVASYCGNTPQYDKLEALYKKYSASLVIIGFPCNQFGSQEPGSDSSIKVFCSNTYHVTFPMASKIDVKGTNQHPIYKWLTSKSMNDSMDSQVAWNFQKYLVDKKGKFMAMFPDYMQPDDPAIIAAIEK